MTEPQKPARTLSRYHVFREVEATTLGGPDKHYEPVAQDVEASSDMIAIRQAIDGQEGMSGKFVAIPARSFRVRTVALQQQTVVKVS